MAGIGIRPLGDDDPKRLGSYRLLWRLTTGGMGRIYLARSDADGPLVAVKTLLADGVVSEPDRKRFAREIDLAGRVDSAYTARVLHAEPLAERPWMAIEYVAAPSLGDLVREAGPLPPPTLPWIAAGAAQALLALHAKGVVHRDVKPQNILLPLTGPLLIDFGISHAFDKTTTSLTLGTIDYTSPEQATGERSTPASDVFSLGATLFHLAVGRAPYPLTDDGPLQRLARVQAGRLDLDGLPAELEPLVLPCLAHDPGRRPALDEVLLRCVEAAYRGEGPDADTERRLPVRWTALIEAYEAHGRALGRDPGGVTAMRDESTRPVPPPPPTLLDTAERAARRERERQAAEARGRREQELRAMAAAARAARAAQEAAQEAARKAESAAREARQRAAAEKERRKAEERRRRAAEGAREEERRRAAAAAEAAAAEAAARRAMSSSSPSSKDGNPLTWLVVVALVIGLLAWHPWQGHHRSSGSTNAGSTLSSSSPDPYDTGASSGGSADDSTDAATTDPATDTATDDSGTDSGSDSGTDSGTDAGTGTTAAAPETTTPEPDPTQDAFDAVSVGDCLPVYDTGARGTTTTWSSDMPPDAVSCASTDWAGLMRVTRITSSGSCPHGVGQGSWTHTSTSGDTTRLCVTRLFVKHYCLLGEQTGTKIAIGSLTAVDCDAQRVPRPYNQVMYITGVYQPPANPSSSDCRQSQYDQRRYWAWLVEDGQALLCTTIYTS